MLCPVTGLPAKYLFTAKDNRGLPGEYDYYISPSGLVFISEIPADLSDHYLGGYQMIPSSEQELAEMALSEDYRLDQIGRWVSMGRYLEIGPWIGLTAYSALRRGYDVHTLEIDQACVDLMRRVGIKAMQTSDPAKTLSNLTEKFDVIAMWHSIEHMPRPWEVVAEAAKALAPDGVLLIAAPNPESAQFRLLGKYWYHLDAPRHLYFLPASMISDIGRKNGLNTVEATTDDRLGKIIERDGWNWEIGRHVAIPGLRRLCKLIARPTLEWCHRQKGAFDGAGFTLVLARR